MNKKKPFGQTTVYEGLHPAYLTLFSPGSVFPQRKGGMWKYCRQVFWLPDLPTFRPFPSRWSKTVVMANVVPGYSGGTAPDFNGISY